MRSLSPRWNGHPLAGQARPYAHALRNERDYIFGPDMGTDETCMAWIKDEIGRAVGLPKTSAGSLWRSRCNRVGPLSCRRSRRAILRILELPGARVAIQGFGAVGRHAARFLTGSLG